jgi:hypothetical protein
MADLRDFRTGIYTTIYDPREIIVTGFLPPVRLGSLDHGLGD